MPRNCNCAGACGPTSENDGITRRNFIALTSIGAAGVMSAGKSWAEWVEQQGDPTELAAWKAALQKPATRRLYRSDTHTDARMHLGGIGTGNFELGVDRPDHDLAALQHPPRRLRPALLRNPNRKVREGAPDARRAGGAAARYRHRDARRIPHRHPALCGFRPAG